jgi:hypothetical protein
MEQLTSSPKQLKLFQIENPLSARLGNDFFRALPQAPGVYFFRGSKDDLLYIGQSGDLRSRIGSYRHVTPEKNPKRTLRLVHRICKVDWVTCASAEEAIVMERDLLLEHRPPFNRAGVWKGNPWWLTVQTDDQRMAVNLTRAESVIGPLPPSFRYALASLIRCLFRLMHPDLPMSDYPHGLFHHVLPLEIAVRFPNGVETAALVQGFARGDTAVLLPLFDALPLGRSTSEQEYWQEEVDRVRKYAAKHRTPAIGG